MSNPTLSIVIITYNSKGNISVLLDSIKKQKTNFSSETIIIDNCSSDGSAEEARLHPLRPQVISQETNAGYAKSVNLGINKSRGDFVLLLNPDTKLIGNCLKTLVDFAKANQIGAVVPRLFHPNGRPQPSVYKFPTISNAIRKDFLGCRNCFGKYLPTNKIQKVEVAVMAAFLIPKQVLESVGVLDERFFLYYEDVEYCRRLSRHQLPIYYLPQAKVSHIHGASGHFVFHLKSPLLVSADIYYGKFYSSMLNLVLWLGHKWQVILRGKRFRD